MSANILSGIVQSLFGQLPVLLVALVACIVTVLNWQQSPAASMYSLAGFGLTLALCILMPVSQVLFVNWMVPQSGGTVANARFLLTGLTLFWAILRAASYCLLLAAVYTGRQEPRALGTPPPVPR